MSRPGQKSREIVREAGLPVSSRQQQQRQSTTTIIYSQHVSATWDNVRRPGPRSRCGRFPSIVQKYIEVSKGAILYQYADIQHCSGEVLPNGWWVRLLLLLVFLVLSLLRYRHSVLFSIQSHLYQKLINRVFFFLISCLRSEWWWNGGLLHLWSHGLVSDDIDDCRQQQ